MACSGMDGSALKEIYKHMYIYAWVWFRRHKGRKWACYPHDPAGFPPTY